MKLNLRQTGETHAGRRVVTAPWKDYRTRLNPAVPLRCAPRGAERLQVTERTVYGWLRRGRLPALKLGRLWRIRPEDLEIFLESARARAP
ncbi:MAG: helix-turn-helix domain-containing protein [Chloroflexi bacterium]|nr:MAG: helix-turn-helix domain-containing protein [Chloroflexota bacterium]